MNLTAQIVNGLVIGCGYALVALGWTLLLGSARVVNFAHGQLYMIGGFVTWWVMERVGVPYGLGLLIGMAVTGVVGLLMQLITLRVTIEQDMIRMMIITLGFGYLLTGLATKVFGGNAQSVASKLQDQSVDVGPTRVSMQDLLIVGLAVVLFAATTYVLQHTRIGRVVRSVAEDPKLSHLFGLNPTQVYLIVFAFSGVLAALAGGLLSTRSPIYTSVGTEQVILSFVIVVVGGVGRVVGNFVAALGVGLFTALFGALVSPAYTTAVLFLGVLVLFIFRPQGIFAQ